jgi:VanZ family protein
MTQVDRTVWHFRGTFVLWFLLLVIGTHLPQDPPVESPTFESPDKLLHFVFFGVLTFLFMCSRWVKNVGILWIIMTAWALLDELSQEVLSTNRELSIEDFIASALGVFATLCWYGALRPPQLRRMKDAVEETLSSIKLWVALAVIGCTVFCTVASAIWFGSIELYGHQQSQLAMALATVISIACTVFALIKFSGVRFEVLKHKKSAVFILFGSILIAVAIVLIAQPVHVNTWVFSMFAFVVGARTAWATAL